MHAADPHTGFIPWTGRTETRYRRQAGRDGRLRAVRKPPAGRADWLRDTVDCRDIVDRAAQQLAEDWPAFWAAVQAAATRAAELARRERECRRLRAEYARLCERVRRAVTETGA